MVKHKKEYFEAKHINAFLELNENAIGQLILKNPTWEDMKDALKTITWIEENWDVTTTG